MRILVLNNYSFDRVFKEIEAGLKPAHHLYGVDFLKKEGYDVVLVQLNEKASGKRSVLNKLYARFEYLLGDMNQQKACLSLLQKGDMIYAPCQTQTSFLSYLSFLGFVKNKIIVVAHHPPVKGKAAFLKKIFFKAEVKGNFAFPALSSRVAGYINSLTRVPKSSPLSWGPDLGYYDCYIVDENPNESGFFCAGRTGRDYRTMIKGAELSNTPLSVYYLDKEDRFSSNCSSVMIKRLDKELDLSYDIALPLIAKSRAVCIPLFDETNSLVGLTSLTDAIGMGKPVIMTRHKFIDIDIEKEGIGIWVDPGSPEKWNEAFHRLSDDKVYAEMSRNALRVRNTIFNYDVFCEQLSEIINAAKN